MADSNDPRQRRTAQGDGNIHKRGDGLGTGPVGNGPRGDNSQRPQSGSSQGTSYHSQGSANQTSSHSGPNPNLYQKPNQTGSSHKNAEADRGTGTAGLLASLLGGSSRGGLGKIVLIIAIIAILGGGGTGLASLFGNGGGSDTDIPVYTTTQPTSQQINYNETSVYGTSDLSSVLSSLGLGSLLGGTGYGSYDTTTLNTGSSTTTTTVQPQTLTTQPYNTWTEDVNTAEPEDETVDETARAKRTKIKGNGKDTVTIMVYMCGTDLESSHGMGTSDLQEMLKATGSDKVNLLVYTGGCKKWKNNVVSNATNQIYQLKDGKMYCLSDNEGAKAMIAPSTLSGYIQYCAKNFPANRYELILWDHGGGSVTGYGYDEKYASSGSMDLAGLNTALKDGGVTFDFIGFDACLMATAETALMLDDYADYMIASEESEPGIGWYYTDWLTKLSANTSMPTVTIGKNIVDDFVSQCNISCKGQATTLSVIDLAEFAATVPSKLVDFSDNITDMVSSSNYKTVATARSQSHEFAASSRIDQIDLVHFAKNLGTKEGKALADAILGAVKYNRTSSNVTNAYGVSIYFPYKSSKYVSTAVKTYDKIGLNAAYGKCIKTFAAQETSGQISSGGSTGSMSSLLGMLGGTSSASDYYSGYSGGSSSSYNSSDVIGSLLSSFLTGGRSIQVADLNDDNMDFYTESGLSVEDQAQYISQNFFDATNLKFTKTKDGYDGITLSKDQWSLVTDLALSVYYDDGEGYIDLGVDNIYTFDDDGNLLVPLNVQWMALCDNMDGENPQAVAYYYESMVDDGKNYVIRGYIPAFLNGERVNLQVVFDNENPYGYIVGAARVYKDGETDVIAKNLTELVSGDELEFVCDYYTYDGEYDDSYYLGDKMVVTDELSIWSVNLSKDHTSLMYRFRDIYNQTYWSEEAK